MNTKVRRNAPCPCGSGKKYKHCHLGGGDPAADTTLRAARLAHLCGETTQEVFEFAWDRLGDDWAQEACEPFFDPVEANQLFVPYAAFHVPVDGLSAAQLFLSERGDRLSLDARVCLEAESEAWLSIWEIRETRPGDGLVMRDRLSGTVCDVAERTASKTLKAKQTVLARVVQIEEAWSINGLYPLALAPIDAAEMERLARGHLRRKREVPIERLRNPKFMRYVIRRWEEFCFDLESELEGPEPQLRNNDGHPILFTTDRFEVTEGAENEVQAALGAMTNVMAPDFDDGAEPYVLLGDDSVLLGQIFLSGRTLRLETNSRERSDSLRPMVEKACLGQLRHRSRVHSDPLSMESGQSLPGLPAQARPSGDPEDEPSPEVLEFMAAFKERHYAEWPDVPLPALDGKTPREAVRTRDGRIRVAAVVDELEYSERNMVPAGQRFDVAALRRELGLE